MEVRMKPEKILVVEDTDFMAELLMEIFSDEGYSVKWAHDGEEALAGYEHFLPDLVTLDIMLPGTDGLEVLKSLMEMDPSCKVLMITAMGEKSCVTEAVTLGAKGFLGKPFTKESVLTAAKQALTEY
jgi:two-component system chemotaxis response regulator CheY